MPKKTPKEIKEFLEGGKFLEQLKECDIRGLGPDLLRKGVIDKDEADDIGFKKGAGEAASNLYMILQRDKSTNKLTALREYLYANTTKETHKDLANIISKFLGIAVYESTPQSKKMKREVETVRGADDESDNEDDNDMGNPDDIKEFLGTILNDLKKHSNIQDVAQQLHSEKVVKKGQYNKLAEAQVEVAGGLLYGFLIDDPSLRKLRCLRDTLLEDSGEQNQALGRKIRKFLKKYEGNPANPSQRQAQKVKIAANTSKGIPDEVKFVSEASVQQQPSASESQAPMKNMEVALEKSLGQRSVHLKCLLEWNKAVCRIRTEPKNLDNEALGSSAGTCFFVKVENKTYCITCCHCVLGVDGWNEVAKAAELLKNMANAADKLKKGQLLLNLDTATIKYPEHPSFSLENAPEYQLKDLLNNPENSLIIAEPELLAIECTNIPDKIKPLEIDSEVTRRALEKLSCSEGAQSVLGIVHIPEEEPHSGHVEFSYGRLTNKDHDFLTYYIDTFYGSSGSPVFLSDANLKDGRYRRVAEVGQGVVVGVHRQGDNKGMVFQNILNKLI